MEEFQSGMGVYFPGGARVVQVDVDAAEIARSVRPDVGVAGDAKLVLGQLAAALEPARGRAWTSALAAFRESFEARVREECAPAGERLLTRQVVHALNRAFPEGFVLVNENGGQDLWSYYCPYLKVTLERGCVAPAEQTVMGYGVAGAVGAKLARPGAHVVCVTGDGAFQMYAKEIPTAIQHGAPALWVVLDNASLHWVKWIAKATGERYLAVDFEAQPDLAAMSEAMGAHAERIERPGDLDAALGRARAALEDRRPAVLVCAIDTWDYPQGFVDFHRDVWGLELPAEP
jgi:acetolactate synthase-1/2/3 large subunit